MHKRVVFFLSLLALLAPTLVAPAAGAHDNPYRRAPASGESVRLSGAAGGASQAWTYYEQDWLERFLRLTIDAASSNSSYSDMEDEIGRISKHVVAVANGTRARIEDVRPFTYRGHSDVEVRVQLTAGNLIGKDVWTTPGELIDWSGHSFVRQ